MKRDAVERWNLLASRNGSLRVVIVIMASILLSNLIFGQYLGVYNITLDSIDARLNLTDIGEVEATYFVSGSLPKDFVEDSNITACSTFAFGSNIDEKSIHITDLSDPMKRGFSPDKDIDSNHKSGTFNYNSTENMLYYCSIWTRWVNTEISFKYRPIDYDQWLACDQQGIRTRKIDMGLIYSDTPYSMSYELSADPNLDLTINQSCLEDWTVIPIEDGFRCENKNFIPPKNKFLIIPLTAVSKDYLSSKILSEEKEKEGIKNAVNNFLTILFAIFLFVPQINNKIRSELDKLWKAHPKVEVIAIVILAIVYSWFMWLW